MPDKVTVIAQSFGGGIQSVAMALMLKEGLLPGFPAPDVSVFADTMAEPPHVYETLDWIEELLPWPMLRSSLSDLRQDTWDVILYGKRPSARGGLGARIDIPAYGERGLLMRQCTGNYKVRVIHKALREFAGANPPKLHVTQYIGISLDEAVRMKPAQVKYIENQWPLVEHRITRADCIAFLDARYENHPVGKSSCYFCPFHGATQWRELRDRYPELYDDACAMDDRLRTSGLPTTEGKFSLVKREEGLRAWMEADRMQGRFDLDESNQFINECEGHCGV